MTRYKGTVAKWLNHKGIGFITPDEGGDDVADVLVHYNEVKQESRDGFKSLMTGAPVEYELEQDPKDESKQIAVRVTGPDGDNCPAKEKGFFGGRKSVGKSDGYDNSWGNNSWGKGDNSWGKGGGKGKGKKGKGKKGKGKGKGKNKGWGSSKGWGGGGWDSWNSWDY